MHEPACLSWVRAVCSLIISDSLQPWLDRVTPFPQSLSLNRTSRARGSIL